jgi:hypothetical protein
MQLRPLIALLALCAAVLTLTGCGGVSDISPTGSVLSAADTAAAPAADSSAALPAFPLDDYAQRAASADPPPEAPGPVVVLGSAFLDQRGGVLDGDTLVLTPIANPETPELSLAWGMYKVEGLDGRHPTGMSIECMPGGLGQQYAVGVADYSRGRWAWYGPSGLPELDINLREGRHRFVSGAGNMYFIVVVHGDNTAAFSQATITFDAAGGDIPPGCPVRLSASDGLPGRVELGWLSGQGNSRFAVLRGTRDDRDPDQRPEWERIAETSEPRFVDRTAEPGRPYLYKVAAINEAGESCFSNVDGGFAAPVGGLDGEIRGRVFMAGTENGVPGVHVALLGAPGHEPVGMRSNERGEFGFNHLPAGLYIVVAQSPDLDFTPRFIPVRLNAETPLGVARFEAHPDRRAHALWGFALTMGGPDNPGLQPLPGTTITVQPLQGDGAPVSVLTGQHGFWMVTELPNGPYDATATLDGFHFRPAVAKAFIDGEHSTPAIVFGGMPDGVLPPGDGGDGDGGDEGDGGGES